jgi:hypothetical protein
MAVLGFELRLPCYSVILRKQQNRNNLLSPAPYQMLKDNVQAQSLHIYIGAVYAQPSGCEHCNSETAIASRAT